MTAEVYTHLMRERFDEGRQRMEDYMRTQRGRLDRPANEGGTGT